MLTYTVVIPAFNAEQTIEASFTSVLGQNPLPEQIIVVDDGSTDRTAATIKAFASKCTSTPIRLLQQVNKGPGRATSAGIRAADTAVIATLDADDLWLPEKMARQLAILDSHPEVALVGAWSRQFRHDQPDDGTGECRPGLLRSTISFRRSVFESVGEIVDAPSRLGELVDWLARLREQGHPIVELEEVLTLRRITPGSLSHQMQEAHARGFLAVAHRAMLRRRQAQAGANPEPPPPTMGPIADPWRALLPLQWRMVHGGRDLLLRAALDPDRQRASTALNQWFAGHAIDATDGREHRLLALVAERFSVELKQRPEGPRLAGLRRQRWTRSQLVLGLTKPFLERMVKAGQPVIVLGETAERCAHPGSARFQPQALDIMLPDDALDAGLAELGEAGWEPWSGESMLGLRQRARALQAMQLHHGPFGCLRLHRRILREPPAAREQQEELLRVSRASNIDGIAVGLPDATHRLAMVLCQQSSDPPLNTLLDAALLLDSPDLNGERLLELLKRCRSVARAKIPLSYLHQHLHLPLPPGLPAGWMAQGASPWQPLLATLQTRSELPWALAAIGRLLSPRLRRRAACGPYSRPRARLGWAHPLPGLAEPTGQPEARRWLGPVSGRSGSACFELDLRVGSRCFGQELVFELQSDQKLLLRLSAWNLWPGVHALRVYFNGRLQLPEGDRNLWITARPSRLLRPDAPETARRRHRACNFEIVRYGVRELE